MYLLLIKQFLRSRTMMIALAILFGMGLISILIGKQFLLKQDQTVAKVTEQQHAHIERNVAAHDEMGLLLYYLRFSLISKPDKLSALSIGQRDINPSVQSVTIRTLEGQKYDMDLTNPVQLQSGNLDLGFVIIYLFPLVIIAFTFNLFSEEKESGVWRIVTVQSPSAFKFLLAKLSVRAIFLYGMLLSLFLFSWIILSIPLKESFWAFVILSVLYLAFWLVLCFWISLFRRSSGFNILTLLSIWVVLTILVPACINNLVATLYPIPESLSTIVKQRDGYHEKWDIDKKVTMDKFYADYPQFKDHGIPNETFSWLWYYAMQHMGDVESSEQSRAMREKLFQRERTSRVMALTVPTLHTQLYFNDLAQTSLTDYVRLLDSATAFHESTRLYFYPKIFANESVNAEDWPSFKPRYIPARQTVNWFPMMLPLIGMSALLMVWTVIRRQKLTSI